MELIPDHARRFGGRLRLRLGVDDEDAELCRGVVVRAYRRCQFALPDRPIKTGRATGAEYRRRDIESRGVGMERAGRAPSKYQLALRDVSRQLTISEAG